MTSIDEHGKLDGCRPAEVDQGVHGGANRAPGVKNVVDEHDGPVFDIEVDLGRLHRLRSRHFKVVAIEAGIEAADVDWLAFDSLQRHREPMSDLNAAVLEPDERQTLRATVPLEHLMRDASKSAPHFGCAQYHLAL
jgi:hypothetical protein